jgi:hypothetical protein
MENMKRQTIKGDYSALCSPGSSDKNRPFFCERLAPDYEFFRNLPIQYRLG